MAQTQFWFQSWTNNLMWSWTNQFWNFQTKQTGVSNQNNSRFPWLNQKYIDEIEERTKNIPNYSDKMQIQEAMYNDFYAKQVEEEKQSQRTEYKNQKRNDVINSSDKTKKQMDNVAVRTADLADLIRKKYNISLSAWTDDEVIQKFISQVNNWEQLMTEYLNWENNRLLSRTWLIENEETFWQKAWDFGVWVLQSPWKRWYNIVWQWIDRATKSLADKVKWTERWKNVSDRVTEQAVNLFWEDAVNAYVEQRDREIENWTIFNGREQTDIRTPILWEERANSKATKAWEVVWDIATAVAMTAPIWMATAPMYASASPLWAGLIWAVEWAAWTTLSSIWTTWKAPTGKELAIWMWLWAIWGQLSRYLAQPKVKPSENVRKEAEQYIQKSIKPTVKGKQNAKDFDKFIDDTIDSFDAMIKNKEVLQYTDDAWNVVKWELPKNMRELTEAIDSMKRYVWSEVDDTVKQAWWAWAQVKMDAALDMLNDLKNNKAFVNSKPWIENMIDDYIKMVENAWPMDIQNAQQLTQNLNNQLKAFFKNPQMNEVSRNAIVSTYNDWVKKAINQSLDDVIWNGTSEEFKALKQLYWKLVNIEDEVSKRALVMTRNNSKWLSQTVIDSLAWWDLTKSLINMDVAGASEATVMKTIQSIYKYMNDPNRYLNKLFNVLDTAPKAWTILPNVWIAGADVMEAVEAQK